MKKGTKKAVKMVAKVHADKKTTCPNCGSVAYISDSTGALLCTNKWCQNFAG